MWFQPINLELEQIKEYFSGRVLNAGCGQRDISDILIKYGADEVINYDIESKIPNALLGSLTAMSFESNYFDAIFCNAVLEHVPQISKVMTELSRVLKPGGFLVVGMPFLQPYHQCPTDFRRYTREGLVELGEMHGLSYKKIIPVHNITQTLGWITWEWAKEKGILWMMAVFPFIWITTRIFYKTDFTIINNANTFQIIYTK